MRVKWSESVEDKDSNVGHPLFGASLRAGLGARAGPRAQAAIGAFVRRKGPPDILRASQLQLLSAKDADVARQLKKVDW